MIFHVGNTSQRPDCLSAAFTKKYDANIGERAVRTLSPLRDKGVKKKREASRGVAHFGPNYYYVWLAGAADGNESLGCRWRFVTQAMALFVGMHYIMFLKVGLSWVTC